LPAAGAVHYHNTNPFDIYRDQGRDRIEAAGPRDIEMRMICPASAP
jgi:hypothetical protein